MSKRRELDTRQTKQKGSYKRHDAYYFAAQKQGFVARSIFKLEEIDQDFSLIKGSARVLDLGCSPGSWLQYVGKKLGPKGCIVGVDLLPVKVSVSCAFHFIQGDAFELDPNSLMETAGGPFDVVLSDMAPNTSGIRSLDQDRSMALCEHTLDLAERVLAPGGNFCVKVLEGGDMPLFLNKCRQIFKEVKVRRPKGTRKTSIETYVLGFGKK